MAILIQFQQRFDTAANWASANPVLLAAEMGFDTTNLRFKVGDGTTAWNSLAYQQNTIFGGAGAPSGGLGVNGDIYFDSTNKGYYVKAAGSWGSINSLQGAQGIQGVAGTGVPTGGTTSQALTKIDNTNFNTQWTSVVLGSTTIVANDGLTFTNTLGATPTIGIATNGIAGSKINGNSVPLQKLAGSLSVGFVADATGAGTYTHVSAATTAGLLAGTSGTTLAVGNDSRLSDARTPTAHAASHKGGGSDVIASATTALAGLMSNVDKVKLNGIWTDVVAEWGADPTGTADATTIIQNALNSFGASGGVLFFPPGTYKVSANITISKPVIVMGAGRTISVINMITATGDIFTMTSGSQGAGFEQMRISANTAGLRTAGYAVDFGAIPNVYMQQCDILFQWGGVKSSGALQFLDDCNIREMGANAANGNSVLITSTGDRYLRRLTMDQAARTVDFAGIRINECSSCVIDSSNIIHCGTALHINASAGAAHAVASVYATNTFFDTSVVGTNITCATGSDTVQRVTFVRCWFSTMSTAGAQLNHANVNSVDFIGCEFYQEPIGIDAAACTEWAVRASRFAGCSTNAIRTTAGATHSFTISDNFIGNGAGFGANAQGINIQAGTYSRYQVVDNRGLDTNTTPGIIDLGVVPVTAQKIVGNNLGCLVSGAMQALTSGGAAALNPRGAVTVSTTQTFIATYRIPANSVSVGQTFMVRVVGIATAAGNPTLNLLAGTTGTLASDTIISNGTVTTVAANGWFTFDGIVQVVTIGASGNNVAGSGFTQAGTLVNSRTAVAEVVANAPTTAAWFITISIAMSASVLTIKQCLVQAV